MKGKNITVMGRLTEAHINPYSDWRKSVGNYTRKRENEIMHKLKKKKANRLKNKNKRR